MAIITELLSEMVSHNATTTSVLQSPGNVDIIYKTYFWQNAWLVLYLFLGPIETELINELFYFDSKKAKIVFRMTLWVESKYWM